MSHHGSGHHAGYHPNGTHTIHLFPSEPCLGDRGYGELKGQYQSMIGQEIEFEYIGFMGVLPDRKYSGTVTDVRESLNPLRTHPVIRVKLAGTGEEVSFYEGRIFRDITVKDAQQNELADNGDHRKIKTKYKHNKYRHT
jgi:hypothetical protein